MKKSRLLRVAIMMLPLLLTSLWSYGQSTKVHGTVSEANGTPLPGVNIKVVGTATGAITSLEGAYEIDVPANGSLEFTSIGFVTQVVEVNNQTVIDVTLESDATLTQEVVVVGYGTQRKEAVTGSVASMKGDEIRDVPSSNITQALQGRVAGVDMEQTSSKPGSQMQIRIRGTRSLNASNDPLVVLDGVPFGGQLSDINPGDIKSLDILKDASATAIYGSRGANGVILITTFKGQKGQKPSINYTGYYGVKKLFAKYPMMEGPEFVNFRAAAGKYTNGIDEADDVNTDWQDMYYRPGSITSHNLSVSGGTEKGSYNFSTGYDNDQAVIPTQGFTRFTLRSSLDQEVGKYIHIGFSSTNNYSVNKGNNRGPGDVLSNSPIANPYNTDGTMKRTIKLPLDENFVWSKDVISNLGDNLIDQTKAYGSYNNLFGEVKIPGIEGLKFRTSVGLTYRQSNYGTFTGMGVGSSVPTTPSSAVVRNELTTIWSVENLLSYDHTFAKKHLLNVVALYSAEQSKYNKSEMSATDIPSETFQFYNMGRAPGDKITVNPNNQDYRVSGLMSWMARAMYSYDDRYMLSVTFRSDGSSRLAEGHKWHSYPAISAGWNISKESFMKNITLIDKLKLYVGYGETSNQSVDPYKTLGLLDTRPYNFGPTTYSTGAYVSQLPNSNLGWEFSKTWNYGLNFSILKSRLSGTVEYYITNTNNILLSVNLPGTSGVGSYTGNIGKMENKGTEVSLNGVILDNLNGWTWDIGVNLYANRNRLVSLTSGQKKDEGNWWFVDQPVNVVYDYEKIGLWQEGDQFLTNYEPGGNAGMIKVKYTGDFNADGSPVRQIGPDDRQILKLDPDFQGGFNTRVAYKGFDLSLIGAFKSGGMLISNLYSSAGYLNLETGRRGNVKIDYWTPDNTGAKYPKPGGILAGDNPKYGSTLGYFDGSYLKIRTITLGYNFENNEWFKKSHIEKLRLYVTVQNPFVMFSAYYKESGMDPETNSYGNENAAVPLSYNLRRLLTIGTSTPSTRNYLIGMNLTF